MSQGRHRARSGRFPPAAIVGISVAAVGLVAVVALFLLRGDGGGILPRIDDDEDQVPAFEFSLGKVTAIPATATEPKQLRGEARAAARAVTEVLTRLYVEAFLDPASWREAAYEEAWTAFEPGAAEAAREDVEVLTAGTTLGASLDRVEPLGGSLKAKVLLDGRGRPVTVVAIVVFRAEAVAEDGAVRALVSRGQFFLRPEGRDWIIFSYKVDREDREPGPVPGPTASPTAVAS